MAADCADFFVMPYAPRKIHPTQAYQAARENPRPISKGAGSVLTRVHVSGLPIRQTGLKFGIMPTPFMHLKMAEAMRSELADGANGRLLRQLCDHWPAFYLGSVAPDYQTICDVPREVTHFYHLPPDPENKAYPRMFATHPELASAAQLDPDHAVFIAAYAAHLLLDIIWFWDVLVPHFVQRDDLGGRHERFLVHNIVLTYLDRQSVASLPPTAAATLAAAAPDCWLPFAGDGELQAWQRLLVDQLRPGATIRTVEIYAGRMAMTPAEYAARLDDPVWMQANVFDRVPVEQIQARLATAVAESITVIANYLQPEGK